MRRRKSDLTTAREMPAVPMGPSRLSLLVIGEQVCATHPLPEEGHVLIGRSEQCDVRIDDTSVSRRHLILRMGPPVTIEDLHSANRTQLRDRWLSPGQQVPIACGEVVHVGSLLIFVQEQPAPFQARRLWPHGYFEGRLEEECSRAQPVGGNFAVLRIRPDRPGGERVLQRTFAGVLRPVDVLGQYGPGDYEVLLSEICVEDAQVVRGRIEKSLTGLGEKVIIGMACFPEDGRNAHALIRHAGAALRGEDKADNLQHVVQGSGHMAQLYQLIERVAKSSMTILLLGETGVGKDVLATEVHVRSDRAAKPFLRLNCAALSETLLESELFGHERGAFTGAVQTKPGLLETAEGGTVFLDEIGELSLSMQVKLLRVLEERSVRRVGGLKNHPIDVRFVAATNRNLEAEVTRGTFRKDLFFRINGITLAVPPLRQRLSELDELSRVFIADVCERNGFTDTPTLADDAIQLLHRYAWPGNIRELRNVMERAVVLSAGGMIDARHLPTEKMCATFEVEQHAFVMSAVARARTGTVEPLAEGTAQSLGHGAQSSLPVPEAATQFEADATDVRRAGEEPISTSIKREVARVEVKRIIEALSTCAGNQTRAAALLGMSRRTFLRRLDAYGIERPRRG